MPIALFMDVHVARAITAALRTNGVDVLTAQEDEAAELPDDRLLDRATELKRVLFSQDKDFLMEAADRQRRNVHFSGVIFSKQTLSVGVCVQDLLLIAQATTPRELENQLVYLPLQ